MPALLVNIVLAYFVWWLISRFSLVAAWLYSKPGTFTARHWVFLFLSSVPGIMEMISTVLVIFAVAFGLDPRRPNGT